MYNTLISSILNDPASSAENEYYEDPSLTAEHIVYEEEDAYPYQLQEAPEESSEAPDEYENGPTSVSTYIQPKIIARKTLSNQANVQKSGLSPAEILNSLKATIDVNTIRQSLLSHNQSAQGEKYNVDASGSPVVDALFTEAVHQFQIANYLDPKEHDGILGQSTLETLGFLDHKLKVPLSSSGFYGQGVLNTYKSAVSTETNNEFTASNWFRFILKPAFLGVKINDGVHLMLLRKLLEAQKWLMDQPQYKGMTPAALGKALGFDAGTKYSASRLSADNQAMHGFGLAIDINVNGNPWIGAGWIQYDKELLKERYRMIEALRKASGDNSLTGPTIFAYLDSIAQDVGSDTIQAYNMLKKRNDEFVAYLKTNPTELKYWKNSQTFSYRDPLKGFLNLHSDLVCALRQVAGLAWGALDFGPRASGDIMHFDYRTIGFGKTLCKNIGGYVPKSGHPTITSEVYESESNDVDAMELHEAIGEATWTDDEE